MGLLEELLEQTNFRKLFRGVAILSLAAFYSRVSVLTLTPVYGGAPSNLVHPYLQAVIGGAGWFLKDRVLARLGRQSVVLLPILAFWIPTIQYVLLQMSSSSHPVAGPVITELLTFFPLLFLSVACGGRTIQSALNLGRYGDVPAEHVPFIGCYVIFVIAERIAKGLLANLIGATVVFTRVGLQVVIASLYAALIPSKWLLVAIPSLLFTLFFNVHLPLGHATAAINAALEPEGFRLIARQESTTGYISVLDNVEDGFRVMRCDHSLLGGQWTESAGSYNPAVKDPIYAVFAMLEGIRLIEDDRGEPRADANAKALVIGLGVGTTPAALINHGIDTAIVEIDPVVHRFAKEYFHLPANYHAVIDDAAAFVKRSIAATDAAKYDYIVHDVFTGGSEPIHLFTYEFLQGLHALLKPDGVIAINYAGDVSSYPAKLVVRTIRAVFPTCRVFRESAASEDTLNFTNMVVYCKKNAATPLSFRAPTQADYLRSKSRESYLVPKNEVELSTFDHTDKVGRRILVAKETEGIRRFQDQAAIAHWKIMRTVLPAAVWEYW